VAIPGGSSARRRRGRTRPRLRRRRPTEQAERDAALREVMLGKLTAMTAAPTG
jgi:hypothetical protein